MCAIDSWLEYMSVFECVWFCVWVGVCVRVSDLKLLAAPTGVVSMDEMLDSSRLLHI